MSKENLLFCPLRPFLFSTRSGINRRGIAFLVDHEFANLFHQGAGFAVEIVSAQDIGIAFFEVFLAFDPKANPVGEKKAMHPDFLKRGGPAPGMVKKTANQSRNTDEGRKNGCREDQEKGSQEGAELKRVDVSHGIGKSNWG